MKATVMTIAGTVEGKQLFAIHDDCGRTVFQIWSTIESIKKTYKLQ